jgi:putative MATE family efflux protein
METGTSTATRIRSGLRLLGDAVRGRGGDPTSGPVGRAIILLAVPMVLEMVMESVFVVVDIFFVARLGAAAVAAVGLTESMMALVYTVGAGLGIGATAIVARRIGERDPDAAATATVQVVLVGLAVSIVIAVIGYTQAAQLLRVMGADDEVVRTGTGYMRVMLTGNAAILFLFLINAAFRGAGDAAIAMRVLWIGIALNLVLDPLLIFGIGPFPQMGVTGAAVATTVGRGVAVVLQILTLLRGTGHLQVRARHLAVQPAVMLRVVRLSLTGTFQTFIGTASWIALVRLLATFGPSALAGYTIAIRIVLFALLPAWGLGNAAATMVGQGLGARDADRAERAVWMAGFLNLLFLGSIGIVFMAAAPAIVALFGADAETAGYAARCLRIVSAGFFFYAYGMVLQQSFNGAGDPWTPTWLNLLCFWLWEIPLAWVLALGFDFGPDGVFIAITVSFCTMTLAAAFLFRRGRWKLAVV